MLVFELKDMLKRLGLKSSCRGPFRPRTVISKLHQHGEKIPILMRPSGDFFTLHTVWASCWKPPEERSEIEKITCPWQKPY